MTSADPDQLRPAIKNARNILILRTDAIGDNVIGSAILGPLRGAMNDLPRAKLFYACQDRAADLFENCPHVDAVISFDRSRAYGDEGYRQRISRRLRELQVDMVLNPVLSREPLADAFIVETGAAFRIGFAAVNGQPAAGCRDDAYTHLIQPERRWQLELNRVREFLSGIGIPRDAPAEPRLWLRPDDEHFAATFFVREGISPGHAAIVFAGAGAEYRINTQLGGALHDAFAGPVVSVGAAPEYLLHQSLMQNHPFKHINMCGRTTLGQTAALIRRARLAIGAETGAAHLACVVGTPNVIVLGGGHFARFMPWSPFTTAVSLPLECFRCDWKCRYQRAHCVTDIQAHTIADGIRESLQRKSKKPRIIAQSQLAVFDHASGPEPGIDAARNFTGGLDVEIIPSGISNASARKHCAQSNIPLAGTSASAHPFRVTAIVSTYKSARFIRGCLQDLVEQTLFQSGQLEVLIIDSASPENESETVREFQVRHGENQIRYHRTPQRETLYAAWNRAVVLSRGACLTSANTDDRHHPEMLAVLADALDAHPDCVLSYCDSDVTRDANSTWTGAHRTTTHVWPEFNREALFEKCYIGAHPLWRRCAHEHVGYFDATMTSAGDYEFWLRLSLHWPFIHVPKTLGLYLENFQSISLGDGGLSWWESRVARERYWNRQWGINPGLRASVEAFDRLAKRAKRLPAGSRVALFGAGQHTQRHLDKFRQALGVGADIVAVLDDRAQKNQHIGGTPVHKPDIWPALNLALIIISSDTYESALAQRAIEVTHNSIPIWPIYTPERTSATHKLPAPV